MKKSKPQPQSQPEDEGPRNFSVRLDPDAEGAMFAALAKRAQRRRGDYFKWLIRREYAMLESLTSTGESK